MYPGALFPGAGHLEGDRIPVFKCEVLFPDWVSDVPAFVTPLRQNPVVSGWTPRNSHNCNVTLTIGGGGGFE